MKIILADDHALIRRGLQTELTALEAGILIVEASDAETLRQAIEATPDADMALVDLNMPGMRGARSIAELHETFPTVPLVVLSGVEHIAEVQAVLRAGAAGFIPKSAKPDVMLQAIRLVLAGGQYLPPLLLQDHQAVYAAAQPAPRGLELSGRQHDVLTLLSQGLPNKTIARRLNLTEGTVKSHLATIFRILGVHNRTAAVAAARSAIGKAVDPE